MTSSPRSPQRMLAPLLAAPFLIAACSMSAGGSAAAVPSAPPVTPSVPPAAEMAGVTTSTTPAPRTWLDIELTDAATGETFTLASLGGRVVAIEPMAIWCSNCRAQQDNVKAAYDRIEQAGVHYISLGVDPNEDGDALARYAQRRGYSWTFVQSPTELSRALNDIFGPQILAVPSTPLIVLDPVGEIVVHDFGFHGPNELLGILSEATA